MNVNDPLLTVLQNIAKAQKDIDKLEADALATTPTKDNARKPTQKNEGVNGHGTTSTNKHGAKVDAGAELAQETDAVDDAAAELEKANIDDGDGES